MNYEIIRQMFLRYYHLPSSQAESVLLINDGAIERLDSSSREKLLLRRINNALYSLEKGD